MKRLLSLFVSTALVLSLCVGISSAAGIPSDLSDICTQQEWDVLKLVNRERLDNGLEPYSIFPTLQQAAGVREQELISLYSHTRPPKEKEDTPSECFTVLTEGGLPYRSAAENIAAGQRSARSVVQTWLNSADHRENIMDPSFTHTGIGYTPESCTIKTATGTGRIQNGWVQLFMDTDCSITGIAPSQQTVSCYVGTDLEALNLYVKATCSVHGTCYLPLLAGMYSGFAPSAEGTQTVTVTYSGKSASISVTVLPESVGDEESGEEPGYDPDSGSGSGSSGSGSSGSGSSGSGSSGSGSSGSGSGSSGTGKLPSFGGGSSGGSSKPVPPAVVPALDTSSADSWAVNWLNRANTLNLLSTRNSSQFKNDVTRVQFADLAVTLAEQLTGKIILPVESTAFTDTTDVMILKAKAAGIAGGYKNDATGTYEFRPNNPITREEICVMLAHVVEYVSDQLGPFPGWDNSETIKGSFPDLNKVESWAVKQVALMANNDIMSGRATDNGALLTPKANTALQESITLAVKIFDKKS